VLFEFNLVSSFCVGFSVLGRGFMHIADGVGQGGPGRKVMAGFGERRIQDGGREKRIAAIRLIYMCG
jgi:hypothetical protein